MLIVEKLTLKFKIPYLFAEFKKLYYAKQIHAGQYGIKLCNIST